MYSILIVDDDKDLCDIMKKCVLQEGYNPLIVNSYQIALETIKLKHSEIVLIILDIMLPDGNGLNLLSEINSLFSIPIIMVTAKDSLEDKVIGLRLGADDYLTKPFSLKELSARINALVRRYLTRTLPNARYASLIFNDLRIEYDLRTVYCKKEEISFTTREFDILYLLASNQGRVFTKKQIYETIWKEEYLYDDNSLTAIICKIRKKIETIDSETTYIDTVRGIGYRFNREVYQC